MPKKVRSIYWGKFAQGMIQILPTYDTTWALLSWNISVLRPILIVYQRGNGFGNINFSHVKSPLASLQIWTPPSFQVAFSEK